MTLYEMSEAARQLFDMLLNDEIDEQTVQDTMEKLDIENKLEVYCKVIRQYQTDAQMYEIEAAKLKEKEERAKKACEKLKNNLFYYFQSVGREKEKAGIFNVSVRKSEQINITVVPSALPLTYQRVKTSVEADKKALKEALKSGAVIDGVTLQENKNLIIR